MPDQLVVEVQRGPHNIIIAAPWDKYGELGQRITVVEIRLLLRHQVELLTSKVSDYYLIGAMHWVIRGGSLISLPGEVDFIGAGETGVACYIPVSKALREYRLHFGQDAWWLTPTNNYVGENGKLEEREEELAPLYEPCAWMKMACAAIENARPRRKGMRLIYLACQHVMNHLGELRST